MGNDNPSERPIQVRQKEVTEKAERIYKAYKAVKKSFSHKGGQP